MSAFAIAAGLEGVSIAEIKAIIAAKSAAERDALREQVRWVLDYERHEASFWWLPIVAIKATIVAKNATERGRG